MDLITEHFPNFTTEYVLDHLFQTKTKLPAKLILKIPGTKVQYTIRTYLKWPYPNYKVHVKRIKEFKATFDALLLGDCDIKTLHDIFKEIDVDNSREISIDEFFKFFQFSYVTPLCKRYFAAFDLDGSGQIDFREFVTAMWNMCANCDDTGLINFAFDVYDEDGSGTLDKNEVLKLIDEAYGGKKNMTGRVIEVLTTLDFDERVEEMNKRQFESFVQKQRSVFYPLFTLAKELKKKVCGEVFWKRIRQRLAKAFEASERERLLNESLRLKTDKDIIDEKEKREKKMEKEKDAKAKAKGKDAKRAREIEKEENDFKIKPKNYPMSYLKRVVHLTNEGAGLGFRAKMKLAAEAARLKRIADEAERMRLLGLQPVKGRRMKAGKLKSQGKEKRDKRRDLMKKRREEDIKILKNSQSVLMRSIQTIGEKEEADRAREKREKQLIAMGLMKPKRKAVKAQELARLQNEKFKMEREEAKRKLIRKLKKRREKVLEWAKKKREKEERRLARGVAGDLGDLAMDFAFSSDEGEDAIHEEMEEKHEFGVYGKIADSYWAGKNEPRIRTSYRRREKFYKDTPRRNNRAQTSYEGAKFRNNRGMMDNLERFQERIRPATSLRIKRPCVPGKMKILGSREKIDRYIQNWQEKNNLEKGLPWIDNDDGEGKKNQSSRHRRSKEKISHPNSNLNSNRTMDTMERIQPMRKRRTGRRKRRRRRRKEHETEPLKETLKEPSNNQVESDVPQSHHRLESLRVVPMELDEEEEDNAKSLYNPWHYPSESPRYNKKSVVKNRLKISPRGLEKKNDEIFKEIDWDFI
eukprot:g264.t1